MRRISVGLGIGVLGLLAASAAAADLAGMADRFCAARVAGNDQAVRAMLSPSLLDLVTDAEDRSRIVAAANPDEKPPFGDGIPFQSFPDRPETCAPAAVTGSGMEIDVTYGFSGQPEAGWTDRIVFTEAQGPLSIDDIGFRGAPDGGVPITLRTVLQGAFDR